MKICPICGKVLSYNSYFGAYICTNCNWEDASIGIERNKGSIIYKSTSFSVETKVARNKRVLSKKLT